VRRVFRVVLVVLIVSGLIELPVAAAADRPLGTVIQAQDALLANAALTTGTTVFAGDSISTQTGGILRLKLGAGQLYLLSGTAASLSQNANRIQATVLHGTAGFSSTPADKLELIIPEGKLHAADGQSGYGQVTIVSPTQAIVSAYRGALVFDADGETRMINAGNSYRLTMVDGDGSQGPEGTGTGSGTTPNKRRHIIFDLIVIGVVGAAISIPLYHYLCESSSAPTN
jgi:hypothetical protein